MIFFRWRGAHPTPHHNYPGPGSIAWKISSDAAVLLGGARAVLLQVAHPLVAQGVSAHSSYMIDPFGRTDRTFTLGQLLTFGPPNTIRQAAGAINRKHTHVFGTLPMQVGDYPAGTHYKARDQDLLLWVHATLIDTMLLMYQLLFNPLAPNEQESYYQESKEIARLLGLSPSNMPSTVQDLLHYVHDMVHSNRLAATPQARQIAQQVLYPPLPGIFRPALHFNTLITCGLLPQPVRAIYGLEWSPFQQRAFDLSIASMRAIIPRLPMSLRILPITRHLMQHEEHSHPTT